MTEDLTQEEIVTQILSSNEILRRQKEVFYISNPDQKMGNLGLFLAELPKQVEKKEISKYSFINTSNKVL